MVLKEGNDGRKFQSVEDLGPSEQVGPFNRYANRAFFNDMWHSGFPTEEKCAYRRRVRRRVRIDDPIRGKFQRDFARAQAS